MSNRRLHRLRVLVALATVGLASFGFATSASARVTTPKSTASSRFASSAQYTRAMTPEATLFEVATTARELWRLVNMRPTGRASYVALVTAPSPIGEPLTGTYAPARGLMRGNGAGVPQRIGSRHVVGKRPAIPGHRAVETHPQALMRVASGPD
jgi:hypothetical protein